MIEQETPDKTDTPGEEQGKRPTLDAECPQCEGTMRLWAGFYRCPNCGYKESCCF